ncbi:hypothetical protein QBC34DRAFT_387131 [Podospora aff. communis PSN243]|uniref:Inhibitor I9 domain-containing protein n=1 Tax=Podospora aff. communis PSN243 TaxID=3040156 RepID=A0AAV9G367_9PEZI|nr:hypothetical protein QBC34DRAFT_387131 [Podospora aff. communis PSN243]
MKLISTISLLTLFLPSVFAESVIVFCADKEATQKARDLIAATGGEIFYEYTMLGGFAAKVTLSEIITHPLWRTECSLRPDEMIPAPRPVAWVG